MRYLLADVFNNTLRHQAQVYHLLHLTGFHKGANNSTAKLEQFVTGFYLISEELTKPDMCIGSEGHKPQYHRTTLFRFSGSGLPEIIPDELHDNPLRE